MVYRKIVDHAIEHKYALVFAAGVAAAVVGKKIIESDVVKEATTDAVAGIMTVKKDAEERVEEIKSEAEAIASEEECEEDKVEIEVGGEAEEVEEKEDKKTSKKASKKSKKSKK